MPVPQRRGLLQRHITAIQMGLPIARIELVDAEHVKAFNAYSKLDLKVTPTLFLEFHGTTASAQEQAETFAAIAEELGRRALFHGHQGGGAAEKLWQARHDAFWATRSLMPGKEAFATDVCVPISRLAECVTETQADLAANGLYGPIVGHVGDGNFHVVLYCDRNDAQEVARVKQVYGRMIERAIAMGGTSRASTASARASANTLPASMGRRWPSCATSSGRWTPRTS